MSLLKVFLIVLICLCLIWYGSPRAQCITTTPTEDTGKILEIESTFSVSLGMRQVFRLLDIVDNEVFVGTTNYMYVLNLDLKENAACNVTLAEQSHVDNCKNLVSTGEGFKCQNYITHGFKYNDAFLFCGTYSGFEPRCWKYNNSECEQEAEGIIVDFLQRDPTQNVSVAFVENDGNSYFIASGRNSYNDDKFRLNRIGYEDRTLDLRGPSDSNEYNFNPPQDFVGEPIIRGNFAYFFYRERAKENNLQPVFYSRVARVCKDELGGVTSPLRDTFTTYLKTRLTCSCGNEYPFMYNEIQDVTQADGDQNYVYALFTSTKSGSSSSAICQYNMEAIENLFNDDDRRGQSADNVNINTGRLWDDIVRHAGDTQQRRMCEQRYDFEAGLYPYLENFPLMNTNAPNCGFGRSDCAGYQRASHSALAVFEGIRGQQLVVLPNCNQSSDGSIKVYIGTDVGVLYGALIENDKVEITETTQVRVEMSSEQVANKWPYGVSSLEYHDDYVYGTVDNVVFKFKASVCCRALNCTTQEIRDRSEKMYQPAIMIAGGVTNVFKIFDGPQGSNMKPTYSGEFNDGVCEHQNFNSTVMNKEVLHVHCQLNGMNMACNKSITDSELNCSHIYSPPPSKTGTITVQSSAGPERELVVDVPIYIDLSCIDTKTQDIVVAVHDRDMAEYEYKLKEWIQNNTTSPQIDTCPSPTDCVYCPE